MVEETDTGFGIQRKLRNWRIPLRLPKFKQLWNETHFFCDYVEFHCMLVRRHTLTRVGPPDERLLSTRECDDFCLEILRSGGTICTAPPVKITYIYSPFKFSDLRYVYLRWSDAWEIRSLEWYLEKWSINDPEYFESRYRSLGRRRFRVMYQPYTLLIKNRKLRGKVESFLLRLDSRINRLVCPVREGSTPN